MAKKRAAGGGRKPKGEFAGLAANITIRMPNEMREQLNRAAEKSKRSVAQEMLWRLRLSFSKDLEKGRDPALRALNFLVGEIAHQVVGLPLVEEDGSETPLVDWRSDPFFYRAFKIAVQQLLEALTPPGKINSKSDIGALAEKIERDGADLPRFRFDWVGDGDADPALKRFMQSYETPEGRSEYALGWVLNSLRTARSEPDREEARKYAERVNLPSLWREFYGMPQAAQDLAIRPPSPEAARVNVVERPSPRGKK